ncbi:MULTISPECIES: glycosyltransferase family 1 protein [Bacillus cereus group]|uniref:glycosyltransferase family 1 protein n=1 Tax=Bacillus cereus group TaxID=86661 RepID=UPI0001A09B91|nr:MULTISPECIES: glycosyltransferase family 1 protein [Bacillus cereus group]EEL48456.1 hypothetical protein bcere0022_43190 [Bacillus cereus Rock3-44]PFO80436.1 glycosyltransferase family 1 protein [Bacillus cereus]
MTENIPPKRVLHIVSGMNRGGAETMIMNIYRHIDRKRVQFDFVSHRMEECDYDEEIRSLGGRIFYLPSIGNSNPVSYVKNLRGLIKKQGPFAAVHAHMDFQTGFAALAARLAGVEKRICHSHNTAWKTNPNIVDNISLEIFRKLIFFNATDYIACGKDAACFLFGNHTYEKGKVMILQNGINLDVFEDIPETDCKNIRNSFNLPNEAILLGHVGRFYEQKNHDFLIDLAENLKKNDVKFNMFLVGDGPLRLSIEEKVYKRELNSYVKFLGVCDNIPQLMKAFDVFMLPSLFEGLPVVLVEAQAAGTPCVVSDVITSEADMGLGLMNRVSLDDSLEIWKNIIINVLQSSEVKRTDIYSRLSQLGYNAKLNSDKIMNIYGV